MDPPATDSAVAVPAVAAVVAAASLPPILPRRGNPQDVLLLIGIDICLLLSTRLNE